MARFADIFICLGFMLFFLGGCALAFLGPVVSSSPLLPVAAILSIPLIGIGVYFKVKQKGENTGDT